VRTAFQQGLDKLRNGELPGSSEKAGSTLFDDRQNIRYRQNLAGPHAFTRGSFAKADILYAD
jgi:hypothetical protein